jgi:outer membrane lipoprotein-sorting protein
VLGVDQEGGVTLYRVEATPKPEAAVVWGKIVYRVRKADLIPLRYEYFSERGELIRTMSFSEVRNVGGHTIPTRWEMQPSGKPGNKTVVVIKEAQYDRPLDAELFSLRNLQRAQPR